MMSDDDKELFLDRKLTDEETKEIEVRLLPYLASAAAQLCNDSLEDQEEESTMYDIVSYIVQMVSNNKSISHIVEETKSLDMTYAPPEVCDRIGQELVSYIKQLNGITTKENDGVAGDGDGDGDVGIEDFEDQQQPASTEGGEESNDKEDSRPKKENALTMAGALGASRDGKDKKKDKKKENKKDTKADTGGKKKEERSPKQSRNKKNDNKHDDRRGGRGGGGRGGRGVGGRDDRRDARGGAGRGGRGGRGGDRRRDFDDRDRRDRRDSRGPRDDYHDDNRGGRNRDDDRRPMPPPHGRGGRGDRDRGPRSIHAAAFDRLAGNRRDDREGRDQGRGGGRDRGHPDRGGPGRGGGGRGRDFDRRGGPPGGRGGSGRGPPAASGNRRNREEYEREDFMPVERGRGRGRESGRGGRNDRGGRGGRGNNNKRARYDESTYDEWNNGGDAGYHDDGSGYYDDSSAYQQQQYQYPPQRGGGRGRGFGRDGRGRGRGRGRGGRSDESGGKMEATDGASQDFSATEGDSAAMNHPSPVVQASAGGRGGYSYSYGGRGRFGRGGCGGRGRFGGRAQVVSMIQSKTWVRKKDDSEAGGGTGGGGGETGGATAPAETG